MKTNHNEDGYQTTARDFFIYLAFLITLVWLIVGLISYAFGVVDTLVADVLTDSYWHGNYSAGTLINSMASLIIVTPFFLFIGSRINKELKSNPQKKHMWVRKWLLYAILFLAFIVALTDLVILLRSFLTGEITARFIWKAISVLVVSSATFLYFLFELRRNLKQISKVPLFSAVSLGVVILSLSIYGFALTGSPSAQRELRLDAQRVNSLEQIRWQIETEANASGLLYETLDEYVFTRNIQTSDPETGEQYGYRRINDDTYELCAVFTRESSSTSFSPGFYSSPEWDHTAGRHCFEIKLEVYAEKGMRVNF